MVYARPSGWIRAQGGDGDAELMSDGASQRTIIGTSAQWANFDLKYGSALPALSRSIGRFVADYARSLLPPINARFFVDHADDRSTPRLRPRRSLGRRQRSASVPGIAQFQRDRRVIEGLRSALLRYCRHDWVPPQRLEPRARIDNGSGNCLPCVRTQKVVPIAAISDLGQPANPPCPHCQSRTAVHPRGLWQI